jgi:fructose-bisphosphate aldolase, class II
VSLVTLSQLLGPAEAGGYAVGAFNVSDLVQADAVLEAAAATRSPVIVQTLAGCSPHTSDTVWWRALRQACEDSGLPVALHLDHGPDPATCRRAIDAGFTSVMIDGSLEPDRRTPASLAGNIAVTSRVTRFAHAAGVSVEGELGTIGGGEGGRAAAIVLADPDQAAEFVAETGVDALAVAIGTSHGAYKFDREPGADVLRLDLIHEIRQRVPGVHLVMHGSSTLPPGLVTQINALGGTLPRSWGVPMPAKVQAIAAGIRKINQGMDSHLAFTAAVRQALAADGAAVDPASYLLAGRQAMAALVAERMVAFGQAGRAGAVQARPVTEAAPGPGSAGG